MKVLVGIAFASVGCGDNSASQTQIPQDAGVDSELAEAGVDSEFAEAGPPKVVVTPESVESASAYCAQTAFGDNSSTALPLVQVRNDGASDLTVDVSGSGYTELMSDHHLKLAPGEASSIRVGVFKGRCCEEGELVPTDITLTTNDPDRPTVIIPFQTTGLVFSVTVSPSVLEWTQADLSADHDFAWKSFVLTNTSREELEFCQVAPELNIHPFLWVGDYCEMKLAPGKSKTLKVLLNKGDLQAKPLERSMLFRDRLPGQCVDPGTTLTLKTNLTSP